MADKIFEPLDTLLMAYKSRLNFGEPLNIQWDNYPDSELEKRRFSICCKRLVKVTQKLVEQNQNKDKNKTQEQQEQPPQKTRETPQSTNQEPQSSPLEIPIEKISKEWPPRNFGAWWNKLSKVVIPLPQLQWK